MVQRLSFRDAAYVWLLVATQSFGGPAGQIAVMHRLFVEERRWLSEERFLHALNYCMLLPGPEATQLVTWVGWLSHGYRGGWVAGWLFVLPGFISIYGLSVAYAHFHQVPAVDAALVGLKAAVLAVVLEALIRIGRRVLDKPPTVLVAFAAFVALFFGQVPFPVVIVAAGLLGAVGSPLFPPPTPPTARAGSADKPLLDAMLDDGALPHVAPRPARDVAVGVGILLLWLAPTALLWLTLGPDATLTRLGTFFSTAAVVTFGGAYSVLAWVAQHAVEAQRWLTAGEMLDGLGLAETTPGPLIQVVQFVGYLAAYRDPGGLSPGTAGFLGSVVTTWSTFAPSFLWVLAGGPYVERIRQVRPLASALRAITAAVVGVIGNLAVWLTLHVWFGAVGEWQWRGLRLVVVDPGSIRWLPVAIAVAAGVALLRFRLPMTPVLAASAVAGLLGWLALG